jgi:hypothetical protein
MTDVATWSQLLSSIAVLGTLIYLAIETKQNTAAQHAATRLAMQTQKRSRNGALPLGAPTDFPPSILQQLFACL